MKSDVVDRREIAELLKLVEYVRSRGVLGVDQGRAIRKQVLRVQLATAVHALRAVLENVERWAVP